MQDGAVDVDNGDYFAGCDDGDYDLTSAVAVAGYVAGKLVDVGNELGLLCKRGGAADASTDGNGLASDFPLERAEDQLLALGVRLVEGVEAC
jgi:hypothetical protein